MNLRNTFLLAPVLLFCSSCMHTRSITEQYIKTNIEKHTPLTTSSIRTYSIYRSSVSAATTTYLELTGYKFDGTKGLVIGADRYYRSRAKLTGLPVEGMEVTYLQLTVAECQAILEQEPQIKAQLRAAAKPSMSEEVYQYYTVNDRLFMSYRRTTTSSQPINLDLWIDGFKYSVPAKTFTKKLRKLLTY
jgi:hypothetical protein